MGTPVMILGESGSGKSTSLRNMNPEDVILIQAVHKPLPFRSPNWKPLGYEKGRGTVIVSDDYNRICQLIRTTDTSGKRIVIIDDSQYLMANEFMRRSDEKGYDKFNDIGRHYWDVITAAQNAPSHVRVYFLSHMQTDEFGSAKVKTIGKMLDDKITVEGLFTIVLRAKTDGESFQFVTKNNGKDTVKAPMGMFDQQLIDNDLNAVDQVICDYYGINTTKEEKA